MSTPDKIQQCLAALFDEGSRIVFWQDPDREFEESLAEITLDNVALIRLDREPALAVKTRMELEEPAGRYLLYQPGPRPDPETDWFLDVRIYATSFLADRASMHLRELGLRQLSLRNHLAQRAAFLANKERLNGLKRFIQPDDNADDVDLAIMAVLIRADQPDFFNILIALLQDLDARNPDNIPTSWTEWTKYGVDQTFWRMVEARLGYREECPSLRNLLIRLLVADFARNLRGKIPESLRPLLLPEKGMANAVVCLSQWRDSASRSLRFESLSMAVAETIRLDECLDGLAIEDLADVKTFLGVELFLAQHLRDRVMETANAIHLEEIRTTITRRLDGYWATDRLQTTQYAPRYALHRVYNALLFAAELFDWRNRLGYEGLNHSNPQHFYQAYTRTLYRVDQLYRLFHEAADAAVGANLDILKPLQPIVEDCYGNWFIHSLAMHWGSLAEQLIQGRWQLDDIPSQQHFFKRLVQPLLDSERERRVFVIVSDAFRFEAAQELTDILNSTYRVTAELLSQLGVVPSHTALGMAALLPHKRMDYSDNGTLLVDGQSSAGLEQRNKILASVEGIAVKVDDFMAMKKEESRALIRSHRVVVLYHNRIDAVGDHQASEENAFIAVRETINELAALVSRIINNLNSTHLLITADHGFLFQMTPPGETDKNSLSAKPPGTLLAKKRYLLGRNLPMDPMAIRGSTNTTAGTQDGLDFWVPKGANRFHFVGGSRFVHGGPLLQEIVVPVIKVQQVKGKRLEATRTRSVGINLLGSTFKITTNRHRFILIQNEAVSDRIKPVSVRIALYEGETPISNVESVTFDSPSKDMNEWRKEVRLTLASRTFDKKNRYQLIARTVDTGIEELRMDVTIDLAFDNDF
ncbi:MAG: BREX-1 system phosphatase PglZ type A [Magnetococcus sp. YQC-5]